MSFILDALRKSETERQQSAVPSISDVPAVVHRTRVPTWTVGIIAALSAGILFLGWAWWQNTDVGTAEVADVRPSELQPQNQTVSRSATSGAVRNLAREPVATAPSASRPVSASPGTQFAPEPETPTMVFGPPTMMELIVAGTDLPELSLELHVFSATASERFVRINSASYREGEVLTDGPRVLSITAEGVILAYRGESFLLTSD